MWLMVVRCRAALQQDIFLRARVCRNIDGMDLHLFEEALKLRRKFLAEQGQRLTT